MHRSLSDGTFRVFWYARVCRVDFSNATTKQTAKVFSNTRTSTTISHEIASHVCEAHCSMLFKTRVVVGEMNAFDKVMMYGRSIVPNLKVEQATGTSLTILDPDAVPIGQLVLPQRLPSDITSMCK